MDGKQAGEGRGQSGHDADACGDAEQSSGEAEAERLQKKDAEQIGGGCADGFEDGEHVHALLEVGVHGHGDADGSEHHGDKADEAEDGGGIVEAAGERGIAFAEVHDLRVGQCGLKLAAHGGGFSIGGEATGKSGRELDEQTPAGTAAGRQQAGTLERGLGDHDARTEPCAGGDAVRLLREHGGDAEVLCRRGAAFGPPSR